MNGQRRPSLPLQLFFFTIFPLSALLLLITFGSLLLHQQAMRAMIGERDERATRTAATSLSDHLIYRGAAVRALALQAATSGNPEHALHDSGYLLADFDRGMALFDQNGRLLAPLKQRDYWSGRFVAGLFDQLKTGSPLLEPQFFLIQSGEMPGENILFITSQTDDFIAIGGFSLHSITTNALEDLIGPEQQMTAVILSGEGEIIYDAGVLPRSFIITEDHPAVSAALNGASGTSFQTADGTEFVVAYSQISPVGWVLLIEEPWREVADPLLRATELAPLILVPVLILTLTALWFGVRQIVQPLQQLEKKAHALSWGDFQPIESPVGGIHEIQHLQNEMVRMAKKVRIAQQSLRGYLGAVTAGQEEERRRLARDLHDDTIQSLIALNQQIQLAQQSADEAAVLARLNDMQRTATQIVADLRRLTHNLRPIYLEDLGMAPALHVLARDTSKTLGIPVQFTQSGSERRLDPNVELAFYRIAQEALSNVARHAAATSAEINLIFSNEEVVLAIRDDGIGFKAADSPTEMAAAGHFGLLGIQERSELVGAAFRIEAETDQGTTLIVSLPTHFLA